MVESIVSTTLMLITLSAMFFLMGDIKKYMDNLSLVLKNRYYELYNAIRAQVEICPEQFWNEIKSGFKCAQQLLHPIYCTMYVLTYPESKKPHLKIDDNFDTLQPELESIASEVLSRKKILKLYDSIYNQIDLYFQDFDKRKNEFSVYHKKLTQLETVIMDIGHAYYHSGHFDSILRHENISAPGWYGK